MKNEVLTMDSGMSFLTHALTYVEPKVYEKEYANINYYNVIPVSNEAGEGATVITYYSMDGSAVAQWQGSKAYDIPLVDLSSDRSNIDVNLGAIAYDYSLEELRQAQMLNRDLSAIKGQLARRGYEEKAQRVAMLGDDEVGYEGFLNNSNVTASTVVDPGSGTEWTNKTADQIIADVTTLFNSIFEDSEMVEAPNTLLIPPAQWGYINSTPRSSNSDTTILQYIVNNSPYLKSEADIMPINELKNAGAASSDRMVAYSKDPDKVVYHIPMPIRFSSPQAINNSFRIPGEFKLAGVEIRFPGSVRYADGI